MLPGGGQGIMWSTLPGKVIEGKQCKEQRRRQVTTNSSGELTKADDDSDVDSYAQEPTEPYCTE